jgi:RHS repeat-associated protein
MHLHSANCLTSITGATTANFAYNGLGDRVSQNGVNYTLDLNAGLTQALSDGTNTYIYGNGRIAQTQGSATEYFLGDALGSVRQMTAASGAITYASAYDPYGVTTQTYGVAQTAYGYTGEYTSNNMLYLRARYYMPNDGRFLTRDTWMGDYNRPLSLNRWMYVEGNPVNYTDPTGLYRCPWNPALECTADQILAYYLQPLYHLFGKSPGTSVNIPSVGEIHTTGTPSRMFLERTGPGLATVSDTGLSFMPGYDAINTGLGYNQITGSRYTSGERLWMTAFLFLDLSGCLQLPDLIPPRGFKNSQQYRQAMEELDDILRNYGIDDATFRFRGTSTTGLSMNPNKPGKWFSPLTSDIDLSIESTKLSEMLYAAGQTPSRNVPGLFLPAKMEAALPQTLLADLARWNKFWTTQLGVKSVEPAVSDPSLVIHFITDIIYRRGY